MKQNPVNPLDGQTKDGPLWNLENKTKKSSHLSLDAKIYFKAPKSNEESSIFHNHNLPPQKKNPCICVVHYANKCTFHLHAANIGQCNNPFTHNKKGGIAYLFTYCILIGLHKTTMVIST